MQGATVATAEHTATTAANAHSANAEHATDDTAAAAVAHHGVVVSVAVGTSRRFAAAIQYCRIHCGRHAFGAALLWATSVAAAAADDDDLRLVHRLALLQTGQTQFHLLAQLLLLQFLLDALHAVAFYRRAGAVHGR